METLLLEVTHDIFPVNYTSFYLVFILLGLLAVFDTVDSPYPTPFTTPRKYSVVDLVDIFVFFTNPVTNLVYFITSCLDCHTGSLPSGPPGPIFSLF